MRLSWLDIVLLCAAAAQFIGGTLPQLRTYRSLLWGSGALSLISALIPRPGNGLGLYLFAAESSGLNLPPQLFGFAWWILGAWLVKSVFELVLRKKIFPDDNQPHARRLFADLASGMVYVIALVGIIETVLKQPIAGVLATSGVLAIVLGLALQNPLADVFAGLSINIEHPFRSGDWITLNGNVEGVVMEINWRATRVRSAANDLIVIPNSVIAKAIVTNHRPVYGPHLVTIGIEIDHRIAEDLVLRTLRSAAAGSPGIAPQSVPAAYACGFADSSISYQLSFSIDDFTLLQDVQSTVVRQVTDAFQAQGIPIGGAPFEVSDIAHPTETLPKRAPTAAAAVG